MLYLQVSSRTPELTQHLTSTTTNHEDVKINMENPRTFTLNLKQTEVDEDSPGCGSVFALLFRRSKNKQHPPPTSE